MRAVSVCVIAGACTAPASTDPRPSDALASSPAALARVKALRARFGLARGDGTAFTLIDEHVRGGGVEIPRHASGGSRIDTERMHVSFSLQGTRDAPLELAGDVGLYRGGYQGADVLHRVSQHGLEDYVAFEERPAREELRYLVDVSSAAGLRSVAGDLELLDEGGAPRIHMAAPYLVDARGRRAPIALTIEGCRYDADPAPPWGRPVTAPGRAYCTLRLDWHEAGATYPLLVDPAWTTGAATTQPNFHSATLLPSGRVLLAGGGGFETAATKEARVFDPATRTFGAVASMAVAREQHTATLLDNGKVLVTGGNTVLYDHVVATDPPITTASSSAEIFDPDTGTFTDEGSMTLTRYEHSATKLASGKVLVFGGRKTSDPATVINSAELYDPVAHSFTTGPIMPAAAPGGAVGPGRARHAAVLLPTTGKVLIVSGVSSNPNGAHQSISLYDPQSNTFSKPTNETNLGGGIWEPVPVFLPARNEVLLIGGRIPGVEKFDQLLVYQVTTGNLVTKSFTPGRMLETAALLPSGKVLIIGGLTSYAAPPVPNLTAILDPATGIFSAGPNRAGDWGSTATALPSGGVVHVSNGTAAVYGGAIGESCTDDSGCVSGHCALPRGGGTGTCCDAACAGGCESCLTASSKGTCTLLGAGDPASQNGACAAPFTCDGVSRVCPTVCASDAQCAPDYFCATDGSCQPRKNDGQPCAPAADCKGGACRECKNFCADGVCCNVACDASCVACTAELKESGDATGTCGPTKKGIDPHDQCPDLTTPDQPCVADGQCNGEGGCRTVSPPGKGCGDAITCDADNTAKGSLCDGLGECKANTGTKCDPFLCSTAGCSSSCVTSDDCVEAAFCSSGVCVLRFAPGHACTLASQCADGFCVDGLCCRSVCTGQCEACDVAGAEGSCAPVSGAPHGARAACAGGDGDPCRVSTCNGDVRTDCAGFPGASITCGTASCTNGSEVRAGACDSKGACKVPAPIGCGAYACGAAACKTSCSTDADCSPGNTCDTSTSKCVSGATCDGDHTTTGANGKVQDCAPFKCNSAGTCRVECVSVEDCVAPSVCNEAHQCVAPSVSASSDSGCSVVTDRGRSFADLWVVALALAAAIRRRGQRQKQPPCRSEGSPASGQAGQSAT